LGRVRDSLDWLHGYSLSGVWRVLQRLGIGWRAGRPQRFGPDPAYAEKVAALLAALQVATQQPERTVVVFLDEMGFYRWPEGGRDWMPQAPQPVTVAPCVGSNRQWRLIGALNALTGQVHYLDNYIVGRRQVGQLYTQLDQCYPHAERITIVQDNWSIHRHPDVLAVAASLPRLELVWLPTYAPWLNPIEKLWRWLRQDVLRLHRWAADWDALLSQVHAFLNQFAHGSDALLHYVGLAGNGLLAQAIHPS
jgi:hypothetical protein